MSKFCMIHALSFEGNVCTNCLDADIARQNHTITILNRDVNDLRREVDLLKKKPNLPLELMTIKRYVNGEAVELYRDGQVDMLMAEAKVAIMKALMSKTDLGGEYTIAVSWKDVPKEMTNDPR